MDLRVISNILDKNKYLLLLPGIELRFLGSLAHQEVAVATKISTICELLSLDTNSRIPLNVGDHYRTARCHNPEDCSLFTPQYSVSSGLSPCSFLRLSYQVPCTYIVVMLHSFGLCLLSAFACSCEKLLLACHVCLSEWNIMTPTAQMVMKFHVGDFY